MSAFAAVKTVVVRVGDDARLFVNLGTIGDKSVVLLSRKDNVSNVDDYAGAKEDALRTRLTLTPHEGREFAFAYPGDSVCTIDDEWVEVPDTIKVFVTVKKKDGTLVNEAWYAGKHNVNGFMCAYVSHTNLVEILPGHIIEGFRYGKTVPRTLVSVEYMTECVSVGAYVKLSNSARWKDDDKCLVGGSRGQVTCSCERGERGGGAESMWNVKTDEGVCSTYSSSDLVVVPSVGGAIVAVMQRFAVGGVEYVHRLEGCVPELFSGITVRLPTYLVDLAYVTGALEQFIVNEVNAKFTIGYDGYKRGRVLEQAISLSKVERYLAKWKRYLSTLLEAKVPPVLSSKERRKRLRDSTCGGEGCDSTSFAACKNGTASASCTACGRVRAQFAVTTETQLFCGAPPDPNFHDATNLCTLSSSDTLNPRLAEVHSGILYFVEKSAFGVARTGPCLRDKQTGDLQTFLFSQRDRVLGSSCDRTWMQMEHVITTVFARLRRDAEKLHNLPLVYGACCVWGMRRVRGVIPPPQEVTMVKIRAPVIQRWYESLPPRLGTPMGSRKRKADVQWSRDVVTCGGDLVFTVEGVNVSVNRVRCTVRTTDPQILYESAFGVSVFRVPEVVCSDEDVQVSLHTPLGDAHLYEEDIGALLTEGSLVLWLGSQNKYRARLNVWRPKTKKTKVIKWVFVPSSKVGSYGSYGSYVRPPSRPTTRSLYEESDDSDSDSDSD